MRKVALIFGILILLLSCKKMDHYEINGNVYNVPDSTILMLGKVIYNTGTLIQTDTIINGKFSFNGTLADGPTEMTIMARDMQHFSAYTSLWVDHLKIKVSGSNNYLSTWKVRSKSPEQKILNYLQNKSQDQIKTRDSLWLLMVNARDQVTQTSIKKKFDSITNEFYKMEFNLLKKKYNSLTSVKELYRITKFSSVDKNEIRNVLNNMDSKYKNALYGEGILAELNKPIPPKIGDKMPDAEVSDLSGKKFRLSDFSGNYILLDFWSLACYPCRLAAPELRELNKTYKNDLTIIGLNMDTDIKTWTEASKVDSMTWINLSDGKGDIAGISSIYGIKAFPTYILINPLDTIIEIWEGYFKGIMKDKISSYLTNKK
jgi:peroxiredoxin